MTKETEQEKAIEKALKWIKTKAGRKALKKAISDSQAEADKLKKKIDPIKLITPMDI